MDKETKEYLEKITKDLASKSDIDGIHKKIDKMDGRIGELDGRIDKLDGRIDKLDGRIDRLDSKNDKAHKDILGYLEHLDKDAQEHYHNSDIHKPVTSTF